MHHRKAALLLAFILAASWTLAGAQPRQRPTAPLTDEQKLLEAMHLISSEPLFDYVKELCSEKYAGRLTGTRKHESLTIVKAFDAASPYLYKAVCEGQTFKSVELKWYQIDETGTETEYFNHKLEGVKICSVKPIMYNVKDPSKERLVHMEEVSMRYKKITWTYLDGNLQASDSWGEGR